MGRRGARCDEHPMKYRPDPIQHPSSFSVSLRAALSLPDRHLEELRLCARSGITMAIVTTAYSRRLRWTRRRVSLALPPVTSSGHVGREIVAILSACTAYLSLKSAAPTKVPGKAQGIHLAASVMVRDQGKAAPPGQRVGRAGPRRHVGQSAFYGRCSQFTPLADLPSLEMLG